MRLTVLEIFSFVTLVGLLAAGAMQGNPYTSTPYVELIANLAAATLCCGMLICTFVVTERRKAYSIGFVVPVCLYGLTLLNAGRDEFDLNKKPKHMVTNYIRTLYSSLSRDVVIDMDTGEEIEDFASLTLDERSELMTLFMKIPNPTNFLYFSHILIAISLGYVGANFGRLMFWFDSRARRTKR